MEGGARRRRARKVVRKPKSLRSKSPRSRGGAEEEVVEEEEMEGGARRRRARKVVRKPKSLRSKSPRRARGGAEEEEMEGGARRKVAKHHRKLSKYISYVKTRMCDLKKTEPSLPAIEKMKKIAAEWNAKKKM